MEPHSETTLPRNAALIVIDVQEGIDDPRNGRRNNPEAESNIERLLAAWRHTGRPVFHIHHHSTEPNSALRPGLPGAAVKPEAKPLADEPVIVKHVNSAFIGTDLEDRLRDRGIETVVMAGLTTNHCVSTSVRMAGNLGFRTYLAGDASAAFDRIEPDGVLYPAEEIHGVTLASLHGEFATVMNTDDVIDLAIRGQNGASG